MKSLYTESSMKVNTHLFVGFTLSEMQAVVFQPNCLNDIYIHIHIHLGGSYFAYLPPVWLTLLFRWKKIKIVKSSNFWKVLVCEICLQEHLGVMCGKLKKGFSEMQMFVNLWYFWKKNPPVILINIFCFKVMDKLNLCDGFFGGGGSFPNVLIWSVLPDNHC